MEKFDSVKKCLGNCQAYCQGLNTQGKMNKKLSYNIKYTENEYEVPSKAFCIGNDAEELVFPQMKVECRCYKQALLVTDGRPLIASGTKLSGKITFYDTLDHCAKNTCKKKGNEYVLANSNPEKSRCLMGTCASHCLDHFDSENFRPPKWDTKKNTGKYAAAECVEADSSADAMDGQDHWVLMKRDKEGRLGISSGNKFKFGIHDDLGGGTSS